MALTKIVSPPVMTLNELELNEIEDKESNNFMFKEMKEDINEQILREQKQ